MRTIEQIIFDVCEQTHLGARFRMNYSGRFMYGRQCIAIVGQWHDCMELIGAVAYELHVEDEPARDFKSAITSLMKFSMDEMGLERVFYWPHLSPKNVNQEEENDGQ